MGLLLDAQLAFAQSGGTIPEGPQTTLVKASAFSAVPIVEIVNQGPKQGSYHLLCSGTLIGPRTLLTAAHCFLTKRGNALVEVNKTAKVWSQPGRASRLAKDLISLSCEIHPDYVPDVNEAPDFAICLLSSPIAWLQPEWIILDSAIMRSPAGQRLHLLGFGCTEQVGRAKPIYDGDILLRTAPAEVLASRFAYPGGGEFILVENALYQRVLCAGDSGGATVANITDAGQPFNSDVWYDGNHVVVGVNSGLIREEEKLSLLASTLSVEFQSFFERWQQQHPQETVCVFNQDAPDASKICRKLSIR